MPVNEKILFRSFQYLFSLKSIIYDILSSAMLRENHAVVFDQNIDPCIYMHIAIRATMAKQKARNIFVYILIRTSNNVGRRIRIPITIKAETVDVEAHNIPVAMKTYNWSRGGISIRCCRFASL
jgi:hypothetical protein